MPKISTRGKDSTTNQEIKLHADYTQEEVQQFDSVFEKVQTAKAKYRVVGEDKRRKSGLTEKDLTEKMGLEEAEVGAIVKCYAFDIANANDIVSDLDEFKMTLKLVEIPFKVGDYDFTLAFDQKTALVIKEHAITKGASEELELEVGVQSKRGGTYLLQYIDEE